MLLFLTIRFELLNHQTEFAASPNSFLMLVFATDAVFSTLSMVGAFRFAADSQPCSTFSFLKTLEWIGQRGYSIYLFHGPVAKLVTMAAAAAHWTGPLAMLGILLISGALTLLLAALSQQWLELTLVPWVGRRLARPPQAALANSL
jgi:peptidoglycan/LPS O-acetylase OafA/YrhL